MSDRSPSIQIRIRQKTTHCLHAPVPVNQYPIQCPPLHHSTSSSIHRPPPRSVPIHSNPLSAENNTNKTPLPLMLLSHAASAPHSTSKHTSDDLVSENHVNNNRVASAAATSTEFFPLHSLIYVPHAQHGYVPGMVGGDEGFQRGKPGMVIVEENATSIPAAISARIERRYPLETNCSDLSKLQDMSRASILCHIKERYARDEIYTNVGPILISVNPYRTLPSLYTLQTRSKYLKSGSSSTHDLTESTPPHVYQVAERAFRGVKSGQDQSVIFSGESGAGKTEATKIFLGYIAHASEYGTAAHIRQRLLEANPLIEAFGNAKTARNDNSSRFGAWLEIRVTPQGTIAGATMTNYLLEKTRVVKHAAKERNFHIFYQITAATTPSVNANIGPATSYHVLAPGCNNTNSNASRDMAQWQITCSALQAFGLSPAKVSKLVHGILELTQVDFSSQLHPVTGDECCAIKDGAQLEKACTLLGINVNQCTKALLERDMSNVKEEIFKPHSKAQAEEARDSLAKHIYGRLFDFLVRSVNQGINSDAAATNDATSSHYIGLLDTFGFESFVKNSFEQLLINYCNERIMAHFNSVCIATEERLYAEEGLTNVNIEYESNAKVLEFFELAPRGLFPMLDDEIRLPKGTDTTFLGKLRDMHRSTPSPVFIPHLAESKSGSKLTFGVKHFAGEVFYEAHEFLDKNKDSLPPQLENLCMDSVDDFLKTKLFASTFKSISSTSPKKASPTKRPLGKNNVEASAEVTMVILEKIGSARAHQKVSVATRFQAQLHDLTCKIAKTQTNFVRCLKPNDMDAAGDFHGNIVLDQLRYGGVLEACRLRRNGYSVRRDLDTFLHEFTRLCPSAKTPQELATYLIRTKFQGDATRIRVGKTLVFLRAPELQVLEHELHDLETRAATSIQKMFRRRVEHERHGLRIAFLGKLDDAVATLDDQRIDALVNGPENCLPYKGRKFARVRRAVHMSRELKEEAMVVAQLTFAIQKKEKILLQTAVQEADALKHDWRGEVAKTKAHAMAELELLIKEEEMAKERQRVAEAQAKQRAEDDVKEKQFQAWLAMELQRALDEGNIKAVESALKRIPAGFEMRDEVIKAREWLDKEMKRLTDRLACAENKLENAIKKADIKLQSAITGKTVVFLDDVLVLNRAIDDGEKAGVSKDLVKRGMAVQAGLRDVLAQQEMVKKTKKSWWGSCMSGCTAACTGGGSDGLDGKTTREMDG